MRLTQPVRVAVIFLFIATTSFAASQLKQPISKQRVSEVLSSQPIAFERNDGQLDSRFAYVSRGRGYELLLHSSGAMMSLRSKDEAAAEIAMTFLGADPAARPASSGVLPTRVNYLIGRDPAKWHTGIPTFERVRYQAVYPGIDVVYYGNQKQLEYDFVVAPGADPNQVRIAFDGADSFKVTKEGELILNAGGRYVLQRRPIAYQMLDGRRVDVPVAYKLAAGGQVVFDVAPYDCRSELIIDPSIVFSTFFGGLTDAEILSMAVDGGGNIYIAGSIAGKGGLATPGVLQTESHNTKSTFQNTVYTSYDGFVAKISSLGSALEFMTYIGGFGHDAIWGIAIDPTGSIVIGGETTSRDFPTTLGSNQPSLPNGFSDLKGLATHGFVARLNGAGSGFIYSTYLGGDTVYAFDRVLAVATDSSGAAYATGETESADFPVTGGAFQTAGAYDQLLGRHDAFATKFDASGALVYSTYLGGPHGYDRADAIVVDGGGNAYIRSRTDYFDFPRTTTVLGTGNYYVTKLNPTGTALVYSTGLGGNGQRSVFNETVLTGGLAVDSSGAAYVTGWTTDSNFPTTAGAYQTTYPGCQSAFLVKLAPDALSRVYATFFGGTCSGGTTIGSSIVVDGSGNVFLVGTTQDSTFPTIGGLQAQRVGGRDAFVAAFNSTGTPTFSTTLGGVNNDEGRAVGTVGGQAIIAGETDPGDLEDFWRIGGFNTTAESISGMAFVAKIDPGGAAPGMQITNVSRVIPTNSNDSNWFQVRGFGFQPGATVTIGGVTASVLGSIQSTDFRLELPNLAPGDYEMVVTNPDTSFARFSPVQAREFPEPIACSFNSVPLNPGSGPSTGGTTVQILGTTGFQQGVTVWFGDKPAQSVTWVSATEIHVVTPAHSPGSYPITILNPDGTFFTGEQGNDSYCGALFKFTGPAPTITSITPSSIPAGATQKVTISGTNLTGCNAGTGTPTFLTSFRNIRNVDDTMLTAEVLPDDPGEYNVIVWQAEDPFGPTGQAMIPFGLVRTAETSITPNYGPPAGGTVVTIKGNGFRPGAEVYLCNVAMKATNVTVVDANTITATTPNSQGRTNCIYWVWNAATDNELFNFAQEWTYANFNGNVTITSIAPTSGYTTGGDSVTINGSGFINNFTSVYFGGIVAPQVTFINSTQIIATTPPHLAGAVDVLVVVNDGSASSAISTNAFTYGAPPPGPFTVSPNKGLPAGGTNISITGNGFQAGATVTIGGVALPNMRIWSSTLITGTTPAHALGGVDIVVTNPDTQTRTLTNGFTYAYPTVTLTPPTSTIAPNATGTLTATLDFAQSTDTSVGLTSSDPSIVSVPASVTITAGQTAKTFTATASANPGSVTITATLPPALNGGTGTATVNVPAAPNIVSFNPTFGPSGTVVTITGTRFTGTNAVTFGGISATFTVNSDTQITATAPNNGLTGPICATTPGPLTGCSTTDFAFPPRITGFTPSSGLPGTSVTINGANFQGATAVSFNGAAATSFTVAPNGASITTTVPSAATTGPVSVTTPAGSATSSTNFGVPPAITSINPTLGGAGVAVTVTGVRFTGATSVTFNGTTATFTVANDTTINTTVPNGATSGPITVTTPGGSAASAPFTVAATPQITGFTPVKGNSGTSVTITGANFSGATAVRFNGVDATSFTVNSDTSITAIAPTSTNGPIAVTSPLGTGTSTAIFAYPPLISTFSPNAGAPGSSITINGMNFIGATAVAFAGSAATFTVNSQTSITATVPASAASGPITVTTPYGPIASNTSFTVLASGSPTVMATATSPTSVALTWTGNAAHSYGIERISVKTEFFSANRIATVTGNSYLDTTAQAGRTYLYHVVDINSGQIGNNDYATTIMFTDDPVAAGIVVKAVHLTEIRNAVNAMRVAAALAPMTWTDPSPAGVLIKPVHVTELRTALRDALIEIGRYINYTDPTITAGMNVRAVHFQEIRNAVK